MMLIFGKFKHSQVTTINYQLSPTKFNLIEQKEFIYHVLDFDDLFKI